MIMLFYLLNIHSKSLYTLHLLKNKTIFNDSKECYIILRERGGRLGNRLFMFASAYGLSLKYSCQLYIDRNIIDELQQTFKINLTNLLSKSQLNNLTSITKIQNHCLYISNLLYTNNSYSIELSGFWQVHKYFIDHMEQIKQQLRFKQSILDRVKNFLDKNINKNVSTSVGIHIRRGDFLRVRRVSSNKYIFNAMSHFQIKYHSVMFIIVSDDKEYCRKTFGQKNNVLVTPDSFSTADDLATLTLCEHTILTAGTFGWWGAFLSHNRLGDVLTDSKSDHTPLDANCRQDDYFPSWFSFLNIVIGIGLVLFIDQSNFNKFSIRRSNYTRYLLLKNNEQYSTTVVIVYFPLSKSKHSNAQYQSWLENLLGFCQSPIIIYTSIEYKPILQQLRRNSSLRTHFIVEYNLPFEISPIKKLVPIFEQQYLTDPERAYHSIELYAVWCAKPFILNRSVELNPFRTKYFLYIDAGAFRSSNYRFQSWPYEPSIHSILANNKLLFGMISPLPRQFCPLLYTVNKSLIRHDLIQAGLMGGTADAIHWWTSVFYETIDIYISKNFFIGKEQNLMNAIALMYPHRINMMLSFRTSCGNKWFAFGPLLANQAEKQRLAFSMTCQHQNLSEVIIPFENICNDPRNVK
ncbi:unnamed protein product [Adineta steineri]|uniref:L-Fucosyltransferase n=1 Tax=Adineta steineri TaxID=433720 RepID=A0A814BXZ3_9BILA|nr:unnamed protein product [Adineta steineri]CAF0970638.1 unnamed protein product [Adineta steineri]